MPNEERIQIAAVLPCTNDVHESMKIHDMQQRGRARRAVLIRIFGAEADDGAVL